MRKYEISFPSVNSASYSKSITALVIEPDNIDSETGAMLFSHGWGGNRFQHQDKMEYSTENFNVISIATEYRQSGYDFDAVKGLGSYLPYDGSFYQVFDTLNAFRELLRIRPVINRERLFNYGGSQGGHVALLCSIFAPDTFAFTYASSPITHFDEIRINWTARTFAEHELAVRNVVDHADLIKCPLFLEHGTADPTVDCLHTEKLEKKLKKLKKKHTVKYYKGGDHALMPTISKFDAFKAMAPDAMKKLRSKRKDDFLKKSKVKIPCGPKTLCIDWSKPTDSTELFHWE